MHLPDAKLNRRRLVGYGAAGTAAVAGLRPAFRAAAQDQVEVRLAVYSLNDSWSSRFDAVIAAFMEANPTIKVTVEYRPGDQYWDKLQTEFAAGTAPDISVNQMDWVVPGAARGMFENLTPFVERDEVDLSAYWYSHDLEWVWEGGLYGGLLYAGGQALYVNKDLLDAAGIPFPAADWTWDDLRSAAIELTDSGKNQWGVHFDLVSPPYWGAAFIQSAGGTVLNDARDACTLTTPEARRGLQFIYDLIHTDKVMPVPAAPGETVDNPFLTGNVAFFFGGTWQEAGIRDAGINWDYAHMPKDPQTGGRSVQMGSNAWSILSSSDHKEESWQLVKYLMSEPGQSGMMTLGLPGLKSVVESQAFKDSHAPQDVSVLIGDLQQYGHNYYPTPDAAEWWDALGQELAPTWAGEMDVETGTENACSRIDDIFAQRDF